MAEGMGTDRMSLDSHLMGIEDPARPLAANHLSTHPQCAIHTGGCPCKSPVQQRTSSVKLLIASFGWHGAL